MSTNCATSDFAVRHAGGSTSRANDFIPAWMIAMARLRGAAARPQGSATAAFPTSRVAPEALEKFRRARAARNVSYSMLTEELLARAIWDESGRLVGLAPAEEGPEQEALPLKSA